MTGNRGGYNKEFAAAVLIAAVFTSDDEACKKYGVSVRTLRNYRRRLVTDASLAQVFRTKKAQLDSEWVDDFHAPLRKAAKVIDACCEEILKNPRSMLNPMLLEAVTNAARAFADIVLTNKAIDAQFSQSDNPPSQLPSEIPSAQVDYPC